MHIPIAQLFSPIIYNLGQDMSRANYVACLLLMLPGLVYAQASDPLPPSMKVYDEASIDNSVDPCTSFYQYACGGWHETNPIPSDAAFWSRPFSQFSRQIDNYVSQLIGSLASSKGNLSADEQKLESYYTACMDTALIEERGLDPLRLELALVDKIKSVSELASVLGAIHSELPYFVQDGEPILYVYSFSDPVEGGQKRILWIGPSGLGLPDRSYYDKSEDNESLHNAYRHHIAEMFKLVGTDSIKAPQSASLVFNLEVALAKGRLPAQILRNNASLESNPMTVAELRALTPNFNWTEYFRTSGIPEQGQLNVKEPEYLRVIDSLVVSESVDTWKAYLRWQLIAERTKLLPVSFRNARFAFFGKQLLGQEQPAARSQECVSQLKRDMPNVLSRVFVERVFRPEMRAETQAIFDEIKQVMRSRIESASWMEGSTKEAALNKLDAVRISIGYPEKWLDDPRTVVRADDYYGNVVRLGRDFRRADFNGLGSPSDINWWYEPTTYIGGYYDNYLNAITVTTGMLLFLDDFNRDQAVLYGSLGHFLAHELIHGFDPLGRNYDAWGRLKDWWSEADSDRFDERTQCIADHYSQFEYGEGLQIDGSHLVSEQVAELSAWSIAWEAYKNAISKDRVDPAGQNTSDQRFFIASAQVWCTAATENTWQALANGASSKAWGLPAVDGIVLNLPEFSETFGCKPDRAMVQEKVCKVW